MGRITVVGLGPGDPGLLAPAALAALERAEALVGYGTYLELIDPGLLARKELVQTGMRQEMDRANAALDMALAGREVAVVSGGDPGVYGMAGLVLELAAERGLLGALDIDVVPGIPALTAAAALLGAPLMHDFAAVSLSDLLTPWEVIERRVRAAAEADFVLAIYNPRSRRRDWQLPKALELLRAHRAPQTPVGCVRNAFRPGQGAVVTGLAEFDPTTADMLSIIIVGNSATRMFGKKIITPRGYLDKYGK